MSPKRDWRQNVEFHPTVQRAKDQFAHTEQRTSTTMYFDKISDAHESDVRDYNSAFANTLLHEVGYLGIVGGSPLLGADDKGGTDFVNGGLPSHLMTLETSDSDSLMKSFGQPLYLSK